MSIITNSGKHLAQVLSAPCKKHSAEPGLPCFIIYPGSSMSQTLLHGACGGRIKRAGYNGTISAMSLRLKTPGGRGFAPKSAR